MTLDIETLQVIVSLYLRSNVVTNNSPCEHAIMRKSGTKDEPLRDRL